MKRIILAAAMLLVGGAAQAANAPGRCLLTVHGKTYINGPCNIDRDADGGFRLNTGEGKQPSPYFVYFNKTPSGGTEASWNEDPEVTHANNSLGEGFTNKSGCWSNKIAKICAWPRR